MQNKAAIIVLAIALALVSIYQLSFTGATWKVRKDAREYAEGDMVKQRKYLDSLSALPKDKWSYLGHTFKEVQKKEMNLGLDLKGGMNVILEVSVEDILKSLSNYNPDKTFNEALARAKAQYQTQAGVFHMVKKPNKNLDFLIIKSNFMIIKEMFGENSFIHSFIHSFIGKII